MNIKKKQTTKSNILPDAAPGDLGLALLRLSGLGETDLRATKWRRKNDIKFHVSFNVVSEYTLLPFLKSPLLDDYDSNKSFDQSEHALYTCFLPVESVLDFCLFI